MPRQKSSKGTAGRTGSTQRAEPWQRAWLRACLQRSRSAARWCLVRTSTTLASLRDWLRPTPIRVEVFIVDPQQRRRLREEIEAALRRLRRTVPLPAGAATVGAVVAAQHVLAGGKQVAGCVHVRQREVAAGGTGGTGGTVALIRLALHANGRPLRDDEVLAVLAEQWIGMAVNAGGASVVVPTELVPDVPAAPAKPSAAAQPAFARRHDPLLPDAGWSLPAEPHPNGRAAA